METKKQYVTPKLTVVTVKAERGYAASIFSSLSFWDASILMPTQQVESYTLHEDWTTGSEFFN